MDQKLSPRRRLYDKGLRALLLREGVAVPLQAIRRLEGPLFPEDADE